jgi:hypothetical protein
MIVVIFGGGIFPRSLFPLSTAAIKVLLEISFHSIEFVTYSPQ